MWFSFITLSFPMLFVTRPIPPFLSCRPGRVSARSSALHFTNTGNCSTTSEKTSTSLPTLAPDADILERGSYHVIVNKPGSVKCHRSEWTGRKKTGEEIPMLQRVRETMNRRVNLIHRLDRGASGCLLLSHANEDCEELQEATRLLADALQSPKAVKTYVAITRGEGILNGEDLREKGWFKVERPIKDEKGVLKDATTMFRFVSGVNSPDDGTRASLVLARPSTGRWHQIRRHLNGLSHPILGDSSHGSSKINRYWRDKGLPGERFCLHLARMQLPETKLTPSIDVSCPIANDMSTILHTYLPTIVQESQSCLKSEGIVLN